MVTTDKLRDAVLRQINEIVEMVEATIPANPNSVDNEKLARQTEEFLAAYFVAIELAFPYQSLSALYNKHVPVKESGPVGETNDILEPILKTFRAKLLLDLMGQHVSAYLKGSAEMIFWGTTKGGIPIAFEGPPIRQAIDYARQHCAQLVTKMDEESKQRIAQIIADGIENKRGIPGLARDLRAEFKDMSRNRSQMIARTETADALEQGFMDRADAMGVTGKEVVTGDPCEICASFGDEGVVKIDHEYVFKGESYGERPPFHPRCSCALAPVMLPTKE